jgi:hypothetical protein
MQTNGNGPGPGGLSGGRQATLEPGERTNEAAARVLQGQVLDHLMRVGYTLSGVAGSGNARLDDRVLAAIEDLDDIIREIRDVVVHLRSEPG